MLSSRALMRARFCVCMFRARFCGRIAIVRTCVCMQTGERFFVHELNFNLHTSKICSTFAAIFNIVYAYVPRSYLLYRRFRDTNREIASHMPAVNG